MLLFVSLDSMPYDRVNADGRFVHATGYAIVDNDGFTTNLYDGDVLPGEDDIVISEAQYERYRKQW